MRRHGRVPELDLIRFVAALSVVFYHRARNDVTMFGFLGVHLFFMISGFVILWTAIDKSAWQFVASRISRLFPSFWVCVLLTASVVAFAGYEVTLPQLLANLTMKPTVFHQPMMDSVYWTLQVELKFYALIFLALITAQMRYIERWLAVALLLSLVAAMPFAPAYTRYISLGNYAPLFIAGCVLYMVRSDGVSWGRILMLAVSLVLAMINAVHEQAAFTLRSAEWINICVAAVIAVEFAVLYGMATGFWALRPSPVWYALGAMTYPLYLIHDRAGDILHNMLPDSFSSQARATILIALALLISYLLSITIERHVCPAFNRVLTGRPWRPALVRPQKVVE